MRFTPRKRHIGGENFCDAIAGIEAAMSMHRHYLQSGDTTEAEKWLLHAQRLAKAHIDKESA